MTARSVILPDESISFVIILMYIVSWLCMGRAYSRAGCTLTRTACEC
ncbi:hypothetical protein NGRRMQZB_88 [Escherichia phage Dru_SM1]